MPAAVRSRARGEPRVRRRTILLVILLFLFAIPAAVQLAFARELPPAPIPAADDARRYRVYVVGWGYHTSIIIEQPGGWALGPAGEERAPWVEYAWGDRRFYMESNYWPHAVLGALLWPTEGVMYVDGHWAAPSRLAARHDVYVREVSAGELRALAGSLERRFVRWGASRSEAFPAVSGYAGRFYPARERYIFWSNCNTWTLRMLRDAGYGGEPALVFLEPQVGGRLAGFTRVAAPVPTR